MSKSEAMGYAIQEIAMSLQMTNAAVQRLYGAVVGTARQTADALPSEWQVDGPIEDIIWDMNQLDFLTSSSCCGFDYDNQGEKNHGGAYIKFHAVAADAIRLFDMMAAAGWRLEYSYGTGGMAWFLRLHPDATKFIKESRGDEPGPYWDVLRAGLKAYAVWVAGSSGVCSDD